MATAVPELITLELRLGRSFKDFTSRDRENFTRDLANVAGIETDEIASIVFRSGCVWVKAKIPRAEALRLLELAKHNEELEGNLIVQELAEFLDKWDVEEISAEAALVVYVPRVEYEQEVVFVHGWRGTEEAFGNLPSWVESQTGAHPLLFDYPTGIWQKSPSIEFVAAGLDGWIRDRSTASRIALVAHSMGGLVARRMILRQRNSDHPLTERIRQLTLVASPNYGASLAAIAKKVPTMRKVQLEEMGPNSSWLAGLNDDWLAWQRRTPPEECSVRCVYGTSDDVVSINNAKSLDPNAQPILNAGHRDIVKPKKKTDDVVRAVVRFLREAGFDPASGAPFEREV